MDSLQKQERTFLGLLISLIINLLIIVLLLLLEHDVHFLSFDKLSLPQAMMDSPAPVIFSEPTPQNMPQDNEEIPFTLNLPDDSKFGATQEFSEVAQLDGSDKEDTTEAKTAGDDSVKQQEIFEEKTQEVIPVEAVPPIEQVEHALSPEPIAQAVPQPQRVPKKASANKRKKSSPITHNLTLSRLAEGFLEYTRVNKNEAVDINTRDSRYESYNQKIGWFLQNSFNLNNRPITMDHDLRSQITLHMEIAKNGALVNCYLSPMTNVRTLDDFFLKIVKAAGPFPPLPGHWGKESYKVVMGIHVEVQQGTYRYDFVFRR